MPQSRAIALALGVVLAGLEIPTAMAADEPLVLETITVIGTRTEKTEFENPRSVSVLTRDELQRASLEGLADMLRDVPGVQLLDAAVPGMKRIEIRGESSRRNVILIDGQEITDHSSYGTPLLIDPSSVERVEVLKGPSSVLYGSKAIGGVVNIVTRTGGDRSISGEVAATYLSATDGYDLNGSLLGSAAGWDYRLSAGKAEFQERETASGKLEPSTYGHESLSGHIGFQTGAHYFALKADQFKLASDAWVDPDSYAPPITDFTLELPQRDRSKIGLFYDAVGLAPWLRKLHLDAYHQTIDRQINQGLTFSFGGPAGLTTNADSEDRLTTSGGTLQLDFRPHPDHDLIVGAQYLDDNLDAVKTSTRTVFPFPGLPMAIVNTDDASIRTASVYAQDEWAVTGDLSLLFGLRYYDVKAELNESNHSPMAANDDQRAVGSIGLTWAGFENHMLRLHFDQGYVYPTLLQLFVDSPFSGGSISFGNPDLDPETSDSIEFGWRHQTARLTVDGSVFYTTADNYIARTLVDDGPNDIWENIERATTYGAELFLEFNTGIAGNMRPYLNGTWLHRRYVTDTYSTDNTFTPRFTGRAGLRFDLTEHGYVDGFVRGATDARLEDGSGIVEESDAWTTLNLWLGLDLGPARNLALTLQLNNLADADYRPANELPGPGRSMDVSARFNF